MNEPTEMPSPELKVDKLYGDADKAWKMAAGTTPRESVGLMALGLEIRASTAAVVSVLVEIRDALKS